MGETNERIDRGTWWHDGGGVGGGEVLSGLPMGDYRIYAEPVVEEPLNVRMAEHWAGWWNAGAHSNADRLFRMEALIKRFGLVERSKLPEPVAVPEWVQRWLDGTIGPISTGKVWALKAWIGDALIAGAVRVETPDVPAEVKEAVSALSLMFKGAGPSGHTGTLYNWVLEQVGDSGG